MPSRVTWFFHHGCQLASAHFGSRVGTMTEKVPAEAGAATADAPIKAEVVVVDPKKVGDLEEQGPPPRFSMVQFAQFFGTGLLASVAYLDPGKCPGSQPRRSCSAMRALHVHLRSLSDGSGRSPALRN
jgi:hypothetical protein